MASFDLSGFWRADDGGFYYLQQVGDNLWWAGLSDDNGLQNGLTFCNLFRGTITNQAIQGYWADVPRGTSMGYGQLALAFDVDPVGNPIVIRKQAQQGPFGFGASIWERTGAPPAPTSIDAIFKTVHKNIGWCAHSENETLAHNLAVSKEPVVVFGTVKDGLNNNFPDGAPRTWRQFWKYDDGPDGDMTFNIFNVITAADFYQNMRDTGVAHEAAIIEAWFGITTVAATDPDLIAEELDTPEGIHCEMVMFARNAENTATLLPGWAEQDGNSVLINGRPLNSNVDYDKDGTVTSLTGVKPPYAEVRVTGALAFDIGHFDPEDPSRPYSLELHPVYAVDIITAKPSSDWSGVWADTEGNTYYVHLIYGVMWVLIMRSFRDLGVATAFRGEVNGNTVKGTWVNLPLGSTSGAGEMYFLMNANRLNMVVAGDSPMAGWILRKLYDAAGHPCPDIGPLTITTGAGKCSFVEIEGSTVTYHIDNKQLARMGPLEYQWKTNGGQGGATPDGKFTVSQLPAAGTEVTVEVDVKTANGCVYHGQRTMTTMTTDEAKAAELTCVLSDRFWQISHETLYPRIPPIPPGDPFRYLDLKELEVFERSLIRLARITRQAIDLMKRNRS